MLERLFKPVDNAPLILFRIFFGLVFVAESFGAIFTGWVRTNLVEPTHSFTFIGFEFLSPLLGEYMYLHFVLMGIASIGVTLGYRYRFSIIALTLLWSCVYFMQKTSYNNHYYLMMLIALIMCFLPANRYASYDVKRRPDIVSLAMPQWISWLFIAQVTCVYFYATLAKFYPDWLDGTFISIIMNNAYSFEAIKPLFNNHYFHLFLAYAGIAFDGLIVPALLWKRTRKIAVGLSLFFHLFNSVTLGIGVFPYFALSFSVFFFPPEDIRKVFFPKKPMLEENLLIPFDRYRKMFFGVFIPYIVVQILLPLRHWVIPHDVLWTEEGHRLSWRMMLRSRAGYTSFRVVNHQNNQTFYFDKNLLLTEKQQRGLVNPDMIWQMAQFIKEYYKKQGIDVSVFADSFVSINEKPSKRLINPTVDLANEKWSWCCHHSWILEENKEVSLLSE